MEQALREEGAHILFNGHSNFGFGASFADGGEFAAQQIDDIYYIDDDRFTNYSSDMVSTKVDGMKYGQAYPNWEPRFKDGTSGIMPYTFSEGLPPYNYYLSYQVPGDPTVYKVELSNGGYLERFPDSSTPAWFSSEGSPPDPYVNPEYFITNDEDDYNRCDFVGNWTINKVKNAGYTGEAGYLGYNYQYSTAGSGERTATFVIVVKTPGYYAVMASWFPDPSNATNAKYTIQHADGQTTVEANQRETAIMNMLGVFRFDAGSYTVVLNNDADGTVIADTVIFQYTSDPAAILQAEFSADTASGASPLSVQFKDLSSVYINGDFTAAITNWYWDFGDGSTGTAQNPVHTYSAPGNYTVSLRVIDSSGAEDTGVKEAFITVGTNEALNAEFTALSRMGSERTVVSFVDQSTGSITEWHWDFGDGSTSDEQNPTHVYSTPGSFNVTLTVNGTQGSDSEIESDFVYNLVGSIFVDNTFHTKPHFYSGSVFKFDKVIINTGSIKIPEEELGYSRMFYSSCNSCNYYVGTFHRGTLFCTVGDSSVYTGIGYLEDYLLGYSDEEILNNMNSVQPIHEYFNFNLKPPSMR
jgi:PKD repeat protein